MTDDIVVIIVFLFLLFTLNLLLAAIGNPTSLWLMQFLGVL